jgi:hypothetical protein
MALTPGLLFGPPDGEAVQEGVGRRVTAAADHAERAGDRPEQQEEVQGDVAGGVVQVHSPGDLGGQHVPHRLVGGAGQQAVPDGTCGVHHPGQRPVRRQDVSHEGLHRARGADVGPAVLHPDPGVRRLRLRGHRGPADQHHRRRGDPASDLSDEKPAEPPEATGDQVDAALPPGWSRRRRRQRRPAGRQQTPVRQPQPGRRGQPAGLVEAGRHRGRVGVLSHLDQLRPEPGMLLPGGEQHSQQPPEQPVGALLGHHHLDEHVCRAGGLPAFQLRDQLRRRHVELREPAAVHVAEQSLDPRHRLAGQHHPGGGKLARRLGDR